MQNLKLCESDYRFMCLIWEHEPLLSGQMVAFCAQRLGWKKATTYTTLKKLCKKGFARNDNTIVSSVIPKEQVQAYASDRYVAHTFQGSLPLFLASFLGGKTISDDEAEELLALIQSHREEG